MAKNSNSSVSRDEARTAHETFNALQLTGNASMTHDQAFDLLDKMNDADLREYTSEYWTPEEKNKKYSFLFHGIEEQEIKGNKVKVAKLTTKEGQNLICGDKMLVSACERLQTLPAYIRVIYTDDIKGEKGSYKNISVRSFAE